MTNANPLPTLSSEQPAPLSIAPVLRALQAVFARLIPRFPTLRLAVPLEHLWIRSNVLTGGLFELPVTW